MFTRARTGGVLAVTLFASILSTGGPVYADTIPSPDPTVVVDQPALPSGPEPSIEPSIPEGELEPAPTEPAPTSFPTVAPPAPVGTATFDSTRPAGTVVEPFRSGEATTGSRGTNGQVPRDTSPAPRRAGSDEERPETPSASPTPTLPTASPTPVVTTATPTPGVARGDSAGSGTAVRSTSAQKAPAPTLPTLILGMAVLVGGLAIVRFRAPVWQAAARGDRRAIRGGVGRLQGPVLVGAAGAVIALIGLAMNGHAGWQLWSSLMS